MSYSYPSYPVQYAVPEPAVYKESYGVVNRQSSLPAGVAGATLGLIGGSIAGIAKRAPYMKDGVPTDTFTKTVHDRYIKKLSETDLKGYKQNQEILKKIDKIKTPEELKTLLNNNPEASKEALSGLNNTTEEYLNQITKRNLKKNKAVIKNNLKSANETRYQKIGNEIENAWNADKKKFVKPDSMDEKLFKAIKKSTRRTKAKFVAKYALITAAISGCIAFAIDKLIAYKRNRAQQ